MFGNDVRAIRATLMVEENEQDLRMMRLEKLCIIDAVAVVRWVPRLTTLVPVRRCNLQDGCSRKIEG